MPHFSCRSHLQVLNILGSKFGHCTNCKGKKVLPPFLRVLQGDGVSYETLKTVLAGVDKAGWSTENLVFGSGGALLQRVDRDTQKCAFKCSFAIVDSKPVSAVSRTNIRVATNLENLE